MSLISKGQQQPRGMSVSSIDRLVNEIVLKELESATGIAVRHRVFRGIIHIAAVCMRFREVMKTLTNMLDRLFNIGNLGSARRLSLMRNFGPGSRLDPKKLALLYGKRKRKMPGRLFIEIFKLSNAHI